MREFLETDAQYRAASRVVAELEAKVKAGTATPEDKARLDAGRDHLLIYEWAEEGQRIRLGNLKPMRKAG